MTRKDYIAISDVVSNWLVPMGLIGELCDVMSADNPRFDRERFIRACLKSHVSDRTEEQDAAVAAYSGIKPDWLYK